MTKLVFDGLGKNGFIQEVKTGIPTDYIAYYKFDGDATDETGNWDGTVVGPTLTTDRFGNTNRAYSFPGSISNNRIELGGLLENKSIFSFSGWFSVTISSSYDILFSSFNGPGVEYMVDQSISRFRINDLDTNPLIETTHSLTADVYYHLVLTHSDGVNSQVFINNNLEVEGSITGINTNTRFDLGQRYGALTYHPYHGKMTDIRIYDRVLTTDEIDYLYNESNPI